MFKYAHSCVSQFFFLLKRGLSIHCSTYPRLFFRRELTDWLPTPPTTRTKLGRINSSLPFSTFKVKDRLVRGLEGSRVKQRNFFHDIDYLSSHTSRTASPSS